MAKVQETPPLTVYCGVEEEAPNSLSPDRWHRRLEQALERLGQQTMGGRVYQGRLANGGVRDITPLPLVSLAQILPALRDNGVLAQYAACREREGLAAFFTRPDSVHGVGHAKRVLVHTLVLAAAYQVSPSDRAWLAKAALYHDIGREDDGPDARHGMRSTARARELGLFAAVTPEEWEVARFVINNHCIGDSQVVANLQHYAIADKDKAVRLLHLFKDADGLERVRIHDLDPAYLRTPYARKLPLLAWQLLYHLTEFEAAAGAV